MRQASHRERRRALLCKMTYKESVFSENQNESYPKQLKVYLKANLTYHLVMVQKTLFFD
jgi:hypothetical protein